MSTIQCNWHQLVLTVQDVHVCTSWIKLVFKINNNNNNNQPNNNNNNNNSSLIFAWIFQHSGCKVIIASRNEKRLASAANNIRQQIPPGSPAEIADISCNIRKEDQVKYERSSEIPGIIRKSQFKILG